MFFLFKKPGSIPTPWRTAGGNTRRRVRSTPQVVPLEGRALLSGAAVAHTSVGARSSVAAEVRTDRAFIRSLYLNLLGSVAKPAAVATWVHALESGMTRKQVRLAIMASPSYRALHATAGVVGNSSLMNAYDHGTGVVGSNPGAGPTPNGYLYGYDQGTAIEGANPGGGPTPNGYLYGYDQGTAIAGANPGGGPEPSGYLGGNY